MSLLLRTRQLVARSFSTAAKKVPTLHGESATDSTEKLTRVQVLSWGRGASGQLGGGVEEVRMYPSPVANLYFSSSFSLSPTSGHLSLDAREGVQVGVSCGLFHSGLVVDGQLWVWGKGDGGRLGFGHEHPVFLPTLNPFFDDRPVRAVALGGVHSAALTSQGHLFTWGYGGFGALGHSVYHRELVPRLVEGPWKEKICHVATSGTHTAVITESGELYTWGREDGDGRLGLGPGPGPNEGGGLSIPSKVKALPVPVAAVHCGGFFTTALTMEGQVWNWGANSNYELGRGDKVGGWKPNPIPDFEGVRVIQIASGGYHSLALTDEGKVYSWGFGGHGQLGHSLIQNQKSPRVIDALSDQKIVYIACGGSSSAAITDEGKLFMWGNSKDFQLGVPGLPEVQPCPIEVKFLEDEDDLGPPTVLSVAVGASHAICLISRSSR